MRISDWSSDVCSSDLLLSVVLRESLEAALTGAGLPYAPDDGARLIQAVKDARPFDDVAPALERLRTKYKTAILSNSERAMMQHNRTRLGVPFDEAVLADEVGAYQPDPRMLAALLDRCGCTKEDRKSTHLNSSHPCVYRMPSDA